MNEQVIEKIVSELKHLDEEKINEVFKIVHNFSKNPIDKKKQILNFAGLFEDIDITDFIQEIYHNRSLNKTRDI